jgi:hypothetical protein
MSPEMRRAIEVLIELLPQFESPDFVPATWPKRFAMGKDGKQYQCMPYPDYHPAVERFRDLYPTVSSGIHPYEALPEDESPHGIEFSPFGVSFPVEYFETATLDQIRRYFVLINRGERFSDGHIDGEFRSGKVVAAMKRLRQFLEAE